MSYSNCSGSDCQQAQSDIHQIVQMVDGFAIPAGLFAILIGSIFCFFGLRLFKCILFLIGFGVGFVVSALLLAVTTKSAGAALVLGLLGGIAGGFVLLYCRYVVYFVMGCSFGGSIGLAISIFLVLPNVHTSSAGNATFATVVVLGLLGGILGVWLGDLIVIICTAVSGSLQITAGTALATVANFLQNSDNIAAFFGCLVIEFILFAILGIWFQNSKKEQWKAYYVQNNTTINNNVNNSNSVSINLTQPQQYPGMMYPQQTGTPFMQNPYAQQQPGQQGIQMNPMSSGSEYSQPQQYGYPQPHQNEAPQYAKPQDVNVSL